MRTAVDLAFEAVGTILGPAASQVARQGVAGGTEGSVVGVQISLSRGDRAVPGNAAEDVDRNACVGHPRQSGVAQAVAAQCS